MRRLSLILAACVTLCAIAANSSAGDKDAAAVIEKAIKAYFPKGLDTKNKGVRTKTKGTLHVANLDLDFTQEVAVHAPKLKEVMDLKVGDMNISVTSVYNGKQAWIRRNDMDVKVTDEILAEFKDAADTMQLMQGVFTKDKGVKYSLIGEVKVKDKAAVGVTISREGKKDLNMFFDKQTGLISKVEVRRRDLMSGQEVTEERYITEYQEVAGRKVAKKVEVQRDGKKFMEAEVLEVQIVEKIDDSEFAQPK